MKRASAIALVAVVVLGVACLVAPTTGGAALDGRADPARLTLGPDAAAHYMRVALAGVVELHFDQSRFRRVRCNERVSRLRRECNVRWIYVHGPRIQQFIGAGVLRLTFRRGLPVWHATYNVRRRDNYCVAVRGRHCLKRFRG